MEPIKVPEDGEVVVEARRICNITDKYVDILPVGFQPAILTTFEVLVFKMPDYRGGIDEVGVI